MHTGDSNTLLRNGFLSLGVLILAGVALLAPGIEGQYRAAIVAGALTYLAGLWTHSGRPRRRGGSLADSLPAAPVPPAVILLLLAGLASCDGNHLFNVELGGGAAQLRAQGIASDSLMLTPQASSGFTCPSGKACAWADSATGRIKLRGVDAVDLEAGEARKLQSLTSDPSTVNGGIWYNSIDGEIHYYAAGGYHAIGDDAAAMHLAGTETVTGAKTFIAAAAFNGAVTLGDAAADIIGVKGALRIYNAAGDFYASLSHTATANRALTLPDEAGAIVLDSATQTLASKTLTAPVINGATSASGDFDLSGSSGTTKTTTGAVTIGPGAVGISGDVTLTSTKTLTAGSNTLISGDKLQAAKLAIGSQATGDLLYADSSTSWARLGAGTSGYPLLSGGAGMAPAWAQIGATGISAGTLVYATATGGAAGALGAATVYLVAPGGAGSMTEAPLLVAPRAGTARNLSCYLVTAPGGADTVAVVVRKNAADQTITVSYSGATAGLAQDTTHTFAVSAGDRVTFAAASSAGTAADLSCSVEISN